MSFLDCDRLVRISSRSFGILDQDGPDGSTPITARLADQPIKPKRSGRKRLDEHRPPAALSIDPDRYRSYLLRLWREAPGGPWRCQVQCVGTGRERRFAGLTELFEFLAADAAGGSEGADGNAEISDTA